MTGILLMFIAVAWVVIAFYLALLIGSKIPKRWGGSWNASWVFLLLLPMPLIDEIVGKREFERLCQENSTIKVDRETASGKTVYLADLPATQINGTWVPIRLQPWRYVDAATGEVIVSFNILQAKGGRFIRILGISEGNTPLTFDGYCAPGDSRAHAIALFKELGITDTERPKK